MDLSLLAADTEADYTIKNIYHLQLIDNVNTKYIE